MQHLFLYDSKLKQLSQVNKELWEGDRYLHCITCLQIVKAHWENDWLTEWERGKLKMNENENFLDKRIEKSSKWESEGERGKHMHIQCIHWECIYVHEGYWEEILLIFTLIRLNDSVIVCDSRTCVNKQC